MCSQSNKTDFGFKDVRKEDKEELVKEVFSRVANKYDLKELQERISIKTRQYAKRQTTWARGHMSDWTRLSQIETNKYIKNFKY